MKVNKNTQESKSLYVGVGLFKPLIFNPKRSQLDKVLGVTRDDDYEEKPEFEYVNDEATLRVKDKDSEGEDTYTEITCKRLTVTVWGMELITQKIFPLNFYIYDQDDFSLNNKVRIINQHGKNAFCDSESNVYDWLEYTPGKNKKKLLTKVAKKGEGEFLNFLSKWTNINPFDIESSLFLDDYKKFWKGDLTELNNLISDLEDNDVMVQFGVKTKEYENEEGETEVKESQVLFTKNFSNGKYYKYFRKYLKGDMPQFSISPTSFNTKVKIGNDSMYELGSFLNDVYGDYGFDAFTKNNVIEVYNSEDNPLNNASSIIEEEEEVLF